MAAFVPKRLCSFLSSVCSKAFLTRTSVPRARGSLRLLYSSTTYSQRSQANTDLMKAVDRELKFERKDFLKLPEVMDFACSTEGAVATFSRKFGSEDITVTMDANSAVEMDMMGEEYDSSEEEDEMPISPAFTVSVTKPSGNKVQFECSFNVVYDELSDSEDMRIKIDSVTVVPKDSMQVESLYSAEGEELGKELYDSLEDYLEERGVTQTFGSELLGFFKVFQHKAYTTQFLEKMNAYCSE